MGDITVQYVWICTHVGGDFFLSGKTVIWNIFCVIILHRHRGCFKKKYITRVSHKLLNLIFQVPKAELLLYYLIQEGGTTTI